MSGVAMYNNEEVSETTESLQDQLTVNSATSESAQNAHKGVDHEVTDIPESSGDSTLEENIKQMDEQDDKAQKETVTEAFEVFEHNALQEFAKNYVANLLNQLKLVVESSSKVEETDRCINIYEHDEEPNDTDDVAKKSVVDDEDNMAVDVDDNTEIERMVSATLDDIINEGNELLEDLKRCASSIDEFQTSEVEHNLNNCYNSPSPSLDENNNKCFVDTKLDIRTERQKNEETQLSDKSNKDIPSNDFLQATKPYQQKAKKHRYLEHLQQKEIDRHLPRMAKVQARLLDKYIGWCKVSDRGGIHSGIPVQYAAVNQGGIQNTWAGQGHVQSRWSGQCHLQSRWSGQGHVQIWSRHVIEDVTDNALQGHVARERKSNQVCATRILLYHNSNRHNITVI